MNGLLAAAHRWHAEHRAAVIVEVVSTRGSVPREAGTRMLVDAAVVLGTIGGGQLERQAIETARQWLRDAAPPQGGVMEQRLALGPSLGQCCGGAVQLRYARLDAQALARWPEPPPRFHLQLYGAGHVGRAIVRHLDGIACRVQWIDEREGEFPDTTLPAHIERVCVEPVEAEVATAPACACYLVMTHSHDMDLRITEAILRRGDFAFLGLIGSRTKRARFVRRLCDRDIDAARVERITCPIGVAGVVGKEPDVIAVAAVAQLLQQPAAGSGARPPTSQV